MRHRGFSFSFSRRCPCRLMLHAAAGLLVECL
jgi:hypothetical protein